MNVRRLEACPDSLVVKVLDGPPLAHPNSVIQILLPLSPLLFMMLRTAWTSESAPEGPEAYACTAMSLTAPLTPALYIWLMKVLSGIAPGSVLSEMPAATTSAPGSARRIAVEAAFSRLTYSDALGPLGPQKPGRCGSFQICHARIGSLGMEGLAAQKLPLGPYRWTRWSST